MKPRPDTDVLQSIPTALLGMGLIGAVSLLGLRSCDSHSNFATADRIAPDAVVVMRRDDRAELYERLGAKAFERANLLAPKVALAAVERDDCARVTKVELNDTAVAEKLEWSVYCGNDEPIRFIENNLYSY